MRQLACAKTTDAISTKTTNAAAAEATHVTSAKAAAHVASAKAAHAPATVSSATATATAAGLCPRGKKAAGKNCACQNHHHSSSHDILHWDGRSFPPQVVAKRWRPYKATASVAMDWRWKRQFVVSTKFVFIWNEFRVSEPDMS
jgi:hypothetical protein